MSSHAIDDAPVTPFHWRLVLATAGGPFVDGYLLGVVAIGLPIMGHQIHISTLWLSLIGAASLIGIFFGGLIFGPLTDLVGRNLMYRLNLLSFAILSILQFFVGDPVQLFIVRLLLGVMIGADYPIATVMASELIPRRLRGPALAGLSFAWAIGNTAAVAVSAVLGSFGDGSWRWIFASGVVPTVIVFALRLGIPESPRWLAARGRVAEARAIVLDKLGSNVDVDGFLAGAAEIPTGAKRKVSVAELVRRGYLRPLVFCSVFWMAQIAPSYALRTYQPELLDRFGVTNTHLGTMVVSVFPIIGAGAGIWLVNRLGRRPTLIWSFVGMTAALTVLGIVPAASGVLAILMFMAFNLAEGTGSTLEYLYPNELFPTDLRATGVGFAVAASRIGSAASTFAFPLLLADAGGSIGVLLAGGICAVGLLTAVRMAPETRHLTLDESSKPPVRRGASDRLDQPTRQPEPEIR